MRDYWPAYVPVAERRKAAAKKMEKLRKAGLDVQPVVIEGRKIAKSFWGIGWCDHLEAFSDYENRLPRGRTYARNGSVCHLNVKSKMIEAIVSGSSFYHVEIKIKPLLAGKWESVKECCKGQVSSVLDLLQGKLSDGVMKIVTDPQNGLFPSSQEITYNCNCPDSASMCKHIAAVLYGVGARLDVSPELLFTLRDLDHTELVSTDIAAVTEGKAGKSSRRNRRAGSDDLANVFGIELDDAESADSPPTKPRRPSENAAQKVKKAIAQKAQKTFKGSQVKALRKKFNMTEKEFATHVKVSVITVKNWEKTKGVLNLRDSSLEKLNRVNSE